MFSLSSNTNFTLPLFIDFFPLINTEKSQLLELNFLLLDTLRKRENNQYFPVAIYISFFFPIYIVKLLIIVYKNSLLISEEKSEKKGEKKRKRQGNRALKS